MNRPTRFSAALTITVLSLFATPGLHAQNAFIPLGDLPGRFSTSIASGVSADGTVVVGVGSGANEAFRWTEADGLVGLGDLPGGVFLSRAWGVSADGAVIVGQGRSANGNEAFRWTQADGMVGLGDLPGGIFSSFAEGVSADGAVVVGYASSANGNEAFRWTQADGMVGLGDLPGGIFGSGAYGVSADGAVAVGQGSSANGTEAFRWTQAGAMVGLGDLPGGPFQSRAFGVSADGAVIVGTSRSADGNEAFRWTQADGMVGLGDLPGGGFSSIAYGVSADGAVVVGLASDSENSQAFRWTEQSGMQSVVDWLAENDVAVEESFRLADARGVSADGSTVVGWGSSVQGDEAWLARAGSGAITLEEFTQSFGTTATVPQTAVSLPSTILNGAHHRALLEQDFPGQDQMAWITGDFASDTDNKAEFMLGEVGMAHDFLPGLRAGLSVGHGVINQDLTLNGRHELDGQYLYAEIGCRVPDTSVIVSLSGIYGDWDADIRRGYLNAGLPDGSRGTTDVNTLSGRLRVDCVDAFALQGWSFTPRAAFSVTEIDMDGYTESGGGFPARFNDMSHTATEIRLGLTGETAMAERTTFRGIVEGVHRLDDNNAGFSGQLPGLFGFSLQGAKNDQTWARAGAEITHLLNDSMAITGTVFSATQGEDLVLTTSLNVSIGF